MVEAEEDKDSGKVRQEEELEENDEKEEEEEEVCHGLPSMSR